MRSPPICAQVIPRHLYVDSKAVFTFANSADMAVFTFANPPSVFMFVLMTLDAYRSEPCTRGIDISSTMSFLIGGTSEHLPRCSASFPLVNSLNKSSFTFEECVDPVQVPKFVQRLSASA